MNERVCREQQRFWDSYLDVVDTIYLDLDDTLVDLTGVLLQKFGHEESERSKITSYNLAPVIGRYRSEVQFWEDVSRFGIDLWADLQPTTHGKVLLDFCKTLEKERGIKWQIVTALVPQEHGECAKVSAAGKVAWAINQNLLDRLCICTNKSAHAAPTKLLIDDRQESVESFRKAGGLALTFPQPWNTGTTVKQLYDDIHAPRW